MTEPLPDPRDRTLIEGYLRIPDTGEFDEWAAESAKELVEEESWDE